MKVLSELATHRDFQNCGSNPAFEPCSKRLAKLFEEWISVPAKQIWPYRRLSKRGSTRRDGKSNTEGAGKKTSEDDPQLEPLQPTPPTRTPNTDNSSCVQDPNKHTQVDGRCINSARSDASWAAHTPVQTPPPRPKRPVFNQKGHHWQATICFLLPLIRLPSRFLRRYNHLLALLLFRN
jgi:hypothetical protein